MRGRSGGWHIVCSPSLKEKTKRGVNERGGDVEVWKRKGRHQVPPGLDAVLLIEVRAHWGGGGGTSQLNSSCSPTSNHHSVTHETHSRRRQTCCCHLLSPGPPLQEHRGYFPNQIAGVSAAKIHLSEPEGAAGALWEFSGSCDVNLKCCSS